MTIFENVAFGLAPAGPGLPKKAHEALELVELGEAQRKAGPALRRQQQRVALARAIVNRPDVLLLDEPLGALDLKLRRQMQIELKRIQSEVGLTFIHVTHDQEEAMTMADTIAVMNAGGSSSSGNPDTLYEEPTTTFVANFLGQSNLLSATVSGRLRGHRDRCELHDADSRSPRPPARRHTRHLPRRAAREAAPGRRRRPEPAQGHGHRRVVLRRGHAVPRAHALGSRADGRAAERRSRPERSWARTSRSPGPPEHGFASTPARTLTRAPRWKTTVAEAPALSTGISAQPARGRRNWVPYALLAPGLVWLAGLLRRPDAHAGLAVAAGGQRRGGLHLHRQRGHLRRRHRARTGPTCSGPWVRSDPRRCSPSCWATRWPTSWR